MRHLYTLLLLFTVNFLTAQSSESKIEPTKKDSTDTTTLEAVVITATRTNRQVSSLPLPVLLIGKKEIKKSHTTRLNKLLNEQTGLITIPDFGGGEGIQLQGMDAQYTLILIDGVPLIGRSAGTLDLSRIALGNIKQIEVVKGASSSLYGSEALGGVINIITATPTEGIKATANYNYATNNTQDANLNIDYKKEQLSISAFANRYSTDGYDLIPEKELKTVDPYSNYTFNTKVAYNFSKNTSLLVSGRFFRQDQDYIATKTIAGTGKINEWNSQIKLNHTFSPNWKGYLDVYGTNYKATEQLDNSDGSLYSKNSYNETLLKPAFRLLYTPQKNQTFIAGFGTNYRTLERTDFSKNPQFNSPYVYVQWDVNYHKKWNVILGSRYDYHTEYKSQFSPKLALRYKIVPQLSLKSSIGYGFKAPDFRQLYFDFTNSTVGYTVLGYNAVKKQIPIMQALGLIESLRVPLENFNAALKPESSVSINIGMHYKPCSEVAIEANFFRNKIKDLIDTKVIATKTNSQNVFSYQNINRVITTGLEFNVTFKPYNQLKIAAGYQLLYAKDSEAVEKFKEGKVFGRNPNTLESFPLKKTDYVGLYNRSKHMFNFKVFYEYPAWNLDTNIRVSFRSKYGLYGQYDDTSDKLNNNNSNKYLDKYDDFIAGYSLCNWAVNKKIGQHINIGFGIDNVFDFTKPKDISNIAGRIIYSIINIHL